MTYSYLSLDVLFKPALEIQLAAKRGVTRHHWNFGNMPPQPQVNERQVEGIIFVRIEKQNLLH